MPDGSKWDVPAKLVADSRAKHYDSDPDSSYKEEFEYTMGSDYELKDWATGNMNWDEVEHKAVRVKEVEEEVDFQEGWLNGEKEVIDVEEHK